MNKDVSISIKTFKDLYISYKPYITPSVMVLISFLLIIFAIFPQFQDFTTTLSQRENATLQLQTLSKNLVILRSIDEPTLNSNLAVSLKALPSNKDFESILTTISSVANKSGVALGNFQFKVGDLSKADVITGQFPSLSVNVVINSAPSGTINFLTNMAQSLPVSEIKSIDLNASSANIFLNFYYKSAGGAKVSPDALIIPISSKQQELLNQLSSWDGGLSSAPLIVPVESLTSPTSTPSSSAASLPL